MGTPCLDGLAITTRGSRGVGVTSHRTRTAGPVVWRPAGGWRWEEGSLAPSLSGSVPWPLSQPAEQPEGSSLEIRTSPGTCHQGRGGAETGPARALGTSDANLRVSFLIVTVNIYQGLALGQTMCCLVHHLIFIRTLERVHYHAYFTVTGC